MRKKKEERLFRVTFIRENYEKGVRARESNHIVIFTLYFVKKKKNNLERELSFFSRGIIYF